MIWCGIIAGGWNGVFFGRFRAALTTIAHGESRRLGLF